MGGTKIINIAIFYKYKTKKYLQYSIVELQNINNQNIRQYY